MQVHIDGDEFSAHILTDEAEYNVEVFMGEMYNYLVVPDFHFNYGTVEFRELEVLWEGFL